MADLPFRGLSASSPAHPTSLLSSAQPSLYRDTPTSSPPSSHDRFLLSSSNHIRRKRPSTSSTDSLEVSMGFKSLLSKPADPPSRRKSMLGVGQSSVVKSLSDSEGFVSASRRPKLAEGATTDVETNTRSKRSPAHSDAKSSPLASNQAHHGSRHTPTSSYHTTGHPSRSPLRPHPSVPSQPHHISLGSQSDSSDLDISKPSTPSTPSKSRNVLRRKNSFARDQQERKPKYSPTPTFEIVSPPNTTKRKPPDTANLTPAGAVARAYMDQELRREALAHSAHSPIPLPNQIPPPNRSSSRSKSPLADAVSQGRSSTIPNPQVAILGSKTGRLVAVGSPDDSSSSTRSAHPSTLPHPHSDTSLPLPGNNQSQPSLNSSITSCCVYSSPPTPKEPTLNRKRSYGLFGGGKEAFKSSSNTMSKAQTKTMGAYTTEEVSSPASVDSPSSASSQGGGNKLWRLMKRISTGGLRDKFQADEPLPPVPALPTHFNITSEKALSDTNHRQASSELETKSPKPKPRPVTVSTTPSTPTKPASKKEETYRRDVPAVYQYRASTNVPPSPQRARSGGRTRSSTTAVRPSMSSASQGNSKSNVNPSQTTLMSDDSGVFSSDSGPKSKDLERHILPPSEINARMDPNRPPSTTLTAMYPTTPPRTVTPPPQPEPDAGLPIPPRGRRGFGEGKPSHEGDFLEGRESPLVPSFSVEGAINTFGPRSRPSLSERSAAFPEPPSEVESVSAKMLRKRPSLKAILLPRGPDIPTKREKLRRPSTAGGAFYSDEKEVKPSRPTRHPSRPPPPSKMERRQTNPTEPSPDEPESKPSKPRPRSNSFSGRSSAAGKEPGHRSASHSVADARISRATFKPLDAVPKQLSEAEKMRRWDELLARSDKAGGTLHLGGVGGLESDWL